MDILVRSSIGIISVNRIYLARDFTGCAQHIPLAAPDCGFLLWLFHTARYEINETRFSIHFHARDLS